MKRFVTESPLAGDVLSWERENGVWSIRVLRREGEQVTYTAGKGQLPHPEHTQEVAAWSRWSGQAKVVERGDDPTACVVTAFAHGNCAECGQSMGQRVHIVSVRDAEGSIAVSYACDRCCSAKKHVEGKATKQKSEVAA